ncbi:MAG: quinone-dependent dihydroorotate dehydrogenase, partial [Candidatus Binataceae bacterium]
MNATLDALYARILRPIVFRLDAETAHRFALAVLSRIPLLRPVSDPPELRQTLWGMELRNPVGLAAGMDKDVRAAGAWQAMGFGFVEFGTITPRPQPGNPRPRMWRLPEHRAVINRLGFP